MIKNLVLTLFLVVFATGCTRMMGGLRRDLDDTEAYAPPTVGGKWTERGFLTDDAMDDGASNDRYAAVGHSERTPAAEGYSSPGGKRSWVGGERAESNKRDTYRGVRDEAENQDPSFSNNPAVAPPVKRQYKNGLRATRADFIDEAPNEGSLWASDGQTNYYFTKNKVRGVGDIITVNVEPDFVKDVSTEVTRTLSPREKDVELALAQDRLRRGKADEGDGKKDSLATSAAAPGRAPAGGNRQAGGQGGNFVMSDEEVPVQKATYADIDVSKSLGIKASDTMMAEIVDRYPNGNYKLRGVKRIPYRNGFRLLTVTAVAKGNDISEEDVINSGKLYEYRIEVVR